MPTEIHATKPDIKKYVLSRIYDVSRFRFAAKVLNDPELRISIVGRIVGNARGM